MSPLLPPGLDAQRPAPITRGRRRAPAFPFARGAHRLGAGFTLIELLTVMTIIAILATLLMTTLSSVKRKAREAVCTSNLHQIGIALHLYLDDFGKRPPDLQTLAASKYITGKVLTCPADKTPVSLASLGTTDSKDDRTPQVSKASPDLRVSYQHPLAWTDEEWNRLMQASTRAGVVACTFHDVRSPQYAALGSAPVDGLILRGLLDGTVVRRHVFPNAADPVPAVTGDRAAVAPPPSSFVAGAEDTAAPASVPSWNLFSDDAIP